MNEALTAAKGVESSPDPLRYFLLVLFIVAGTIFWRWGSKVVGAIEVAANELKLFLVKQTEIQSAIKNELVSNKSEMKADLASHKVELDKRIDGTRDEIVDRIEVTKATIVREVRDERIRTLAGAISDVVPQGRGSAHELKKIRDSRPGQ